MKTVVEAIKFRRTMPEFDPTKEVSHDDLELILNAGRLAPSALGAEPTRALVIKNKALKKEIAETAYHSMNWNKIATADSLIILTSANGETFKNKEYLKNNLQRRGLSEAELQAKIDAYADYLNSLDCDIYSANQAYISLAYMSIQAAAIDVESTIMQGFNFEKLNNFLHQKGLLDQEKEMVHISMAIGHSNQEIRKQIYPQVRISAEEFFKIINEKNKEN